MNNYWARCEAFLAKELEALGPVCSLFSVLPLSLPSSHCCPCDVVVLSMMPSLYVLTLSQFPLCALSSQSLVALSPSVSSIR